MTSPSSSWSDFSQLPTTSHSDEQQETLDAENNGNQNGSNKGRSKLSLDVWRTCSVAFIRSDPDMRKIYDRGFVTGFYGQNPLQTELMFAQTEPPETVVELMSADSALASPSEEAEENSLMVVTDAVIESGLNTALEVSEATKMVAYVALAISHYTIRP